MAKKRRVVVEVIDDAMAEVMRQKTPQERLMIGFRMWESAREIVRASIQQNHPDWNEKQIRRETARRMSHGAIPDELL